MKELFFVYQVYSRNPFFDYAYFSKHKKAKEYISEIKKTHPCFERMYIKKLIVDEPHD